MRMREYIEIQSNTATSDGQGGHTVAWTKVTNEWAKAEMLSMSRTLDGQGIKYTKAVRFTMRRRDDTPTDTYTLGGEHRIVWDGNYTIHSVVPDELGVYIVVLAYK
jgi:SPP1 family predicted phage head-tail adaptor